MSSPKNRSGLRWSYVFGAFALSGLSACAGALPHEGTTSAPEARVVGESAREARAPEAPRSASLLAQADALRNAKRATEVQIMVLDDALSRATRRKDALEARREALVMESARLRDEATRAYAAFVDDPSEPASPERRRALAALARLLEEAGAIDEAMTRYQALAREAEGREAAEAELALANLLFAKGELDEAITHCDAAAAGGAPAARAKALYMKSWSLRGLGEAKRFGATREAMEALREVVRLEGAPGVDPAVMQAAEGELVELYARHGDPEGARAFFASTGEAAARLLSSLQARYARTERPEPSGPISL